MTDEIIIGIDIGGTKCAVVTGRTDGTLLRRESFLTEGQRYRPEQVLERLAVLASKMIAEMGGIQVKGVGVSCGGPLDTKTGTIFAPPNLPHWKAVPVRDFFTQRLKLEVRVENDANATALAEWHFGAGQGTRNMVFLTMGTGIGGGMVLEGKLYRGTNDLAGEIGHQTILINGPLCGCGKRGCLEALASGPAIARLARESIGYGSQKRVLELAGGIASNITAEHVVIAAKEGNAFACRILEEVATYMGIGIANLIQIVNPECVVLGTIAVHAGDLLMVPLQAALKEYTWQRSLDACRLVPASLGDRAQDLAAIALWCETSDL